MGRCIAYSLRKANRCTVRRYYLVWRREEGLPVRCDNPVCDFHTRPLEWNGMRLPLILDHSNGNSCDNRPENLRLFCPNCDSQNPETRGGKNIGRVQNASETGYAIAHHDGSRSAQVFLGGLKISSSAGGTDPGSSSDDWMSLNTWFHLRRRP